MMRIFTNKFEYIIFRDILNQLKFDVAVVRKRYPDFDPGLAIIQVAGNHGSHVHINSQFEAASYIGIKAEHVKMSKTTCESDILEKVLIVFFYHLSTYTYTEKLFNFFKTILFQFGTQLDELNVDESISGIIIEMPMNSLNPIDSNVIVSAINENKDIDR